MLALISNNQGSLMKKLITFLLLLSKLCLAQEFNTTYNCESPEGDLSVFKMEGYSGFTPLSKASIEGVNYLLTLSDAGGLYPHPTNPIRELRYKVKSQYPETPTGVTELKLEFDTTQPGKVRMLSVEITYHIDNDWSWKKTECKDGVVEYD